MPQLVTDALIAQSGPLASFLALAVACESGDPEQISGCAQACGLDESSISQEVLQSLAWANKVGELDD
jgi:EAL and modified HD-GYP domain-containing signal transduction protein